MNKISQEVLDQLIAGYKKPEDLLGPTGLLRQLTAALVERAMEAEIRDAAEAALEGLKSVRSFDSVDETQSTSTKSRHSSNQKQLQPHFLNPQSLPVIVLLK